MMSPCPSPDAAPHLAYSCSFLLPNDRRRSLRSLLAPLPFALALLALSFPHAASGALTISPNARHLAYETGEPFLLTGCAGWGLITQPTYAQAVQYLDDRAARGFNLLLVRLLEHQFCSDPPANANGDLPFTGRPFATPNEAYFAHADAVIRAAGDRGIAVLLAPVYLGWNCGPQGWCGEIGDATLGEMRQWGRFLGARYASFDNIVWLIGGDADPSPVADKLREVVAGIREFDGVHLVTAHNQAETQAITPWPGENWLQVNSVYSYLPALYRKAREAYAVTPPMPFFLLESAYENEHGSTAQSLRAQSYWTMTSGGFGHIFGNCPIWHFGYSSDWCGTDDWQGQLDSPGAVNMTHFRNLFESRRWTELIPDLGNDVLVAGAGGWGSTDYATAAFSGDGSSIIAYLPSARAVTIDSSMLAGNAIRAWWYDPATGIPSLIGVYPTGTRIFTPPAEGDWVLVVDDAALGFPAPGVPLSSSDPAPPIGSPVRFERIEPNPFRDSILIRYRLEVGGQVRLRILEASGRVVRRFTPGWQETGVHELSWNGRDMDGAPLRAGIYFVRVEAAGGAICQKAVRLR